MKIRILENSLRLRISQDELEYLRVNRKIESNINFPENVLKYSISEKENGSITANFIGGHISVKVPRTELETFFRDEEVGMSYENGGVSNLKILIEKDFQCIAPREGEDESNLFPNPNQSH